MMIFLVAIVLLIVGVAAIYLLLRRMGEDGVEIAAPGSCKRGSCGVRSSQAAEEAGREVAAPSGEATQGVPPPHDRP